MAKKEEKLTPGLDKVKASLDATFARIEPKLKSILQAAYRKDADRAFAALMEYAPKAKTGDRLGEYGSPSENYYHWTQYDKDAAMKVWYASFKRTADDSVPAAAYKTMPPDHMQSFADIVEWAKYLSVSYHNADKRAKDSVENARDSFVRKNVAKFGNVLVACDITTVDGRVEWKGGYFEGFLKIGLPTGLITAEVSLKYVLRRIPRTTPYYQYPLIFLCAKIGEKEMNRPSEAELREALGNGKAPTPAEVFAAKGYCPGSGKESHPTLKAWGRDRKICSECKGVFYASPTSGLVRAHRAYVKKS
jgi:hypothetical protein